MRPGVEVHSSTKKTKVQFCFKSHLCRVKFLLLFSFVLPTFRVSAQFTLIHSHNDYRQEQPLMQALKQRVFCVEADVYLVGDKLLVAHDTAELATAPTLDELYLQPIVELFNKNNNKISEDSNYVLTLMIDIKKNGPEVIKVLAEKLKLYPQVFDRKVNNKGVWIIISGDRGKQTSWTSYPHFILFDGRPHEKYDSLVFRKVALISDSYNNYSKNPDSTDIKIQLMAYKVHNLDRLVRLWGIPDNPESWKHLLSLTVDIINTDKVEECRRYFGKK